MSKCEIAKNVEIQGENYKIVNPDDACSSINKILARHEGSTILTHSEYEALLSKKASTD